MRYSLRKTPASLFFQLRNGGYGKFFFKNAYFDLNIENKEITIELDLSPGRSEWCIDDYQLLENNVSKLEFLEISDSYFYKNLSNYYNRHLKSIKYKRLLLKMDKSYVLKVELSNKNTDDVIFTIFI